MRLRKPVISATFALALAFLGSHIALGQAEINVHTVEVGDTVRSIAEDYGVSSETVLAANSLDDPDLLRIGQPVLVPSVDGALHTVRSGETLRGIADAYGVSPDAIMSTNSLDDPDLLRVGTVLVVPGDHPMAMVQRPQQAAVAAAAQPAPGVPAPAAAAPALAPTPTPVPAPPPKPTTALVTGYAPGAGAASSHTASGTAAHWGTIAADTRLFPFGTRLRIEGLGDTIFVVEDTGGAVHGNVIDVWFPDADSARGIGGRNRQITVVPPGDP
jgi:3D (Asp-Asp-Asp) domain-containing protein